MEFKDKQIVNDRYEIIKYIDAGGTSKVYLARDLNNEQEKILKVIKVRNEDEEKKVINELRIYNLISKQKNPNSYIMTLYEHFEIGSLATNNLYYVFVIEYIKGITLRKYLDEEHALTYIRAIEYVRQIALGVLFLHNLTPSVIHRDLKPENCMIDESRTNLKIIDLGASSALFLDKKELTTYNAIDCTILYAAPSLLDFSKIHKDYKNNKIQNISDSQDISKIFNPSFDIHSLGVMLYELIASTPPFVKEEDNETDNNFLRNWVNYDFLPLSVINKSIPVGVDNILIKCFASKRHKQFKYNNIAELIDDLNNVLDKDHLINQKRLVSINSLKLKDGYDKNFLKQTTNQKIFLSKWFIWLMISVGLLIVVILGIVIGLKENGLI